MRSIATGAAPLAPSTHLFLKAVFGVQIIQGYSLTESCSAGIAMDPDDTEFGHVGAPVICVRF